MMRFFGWLVAWAMMLNMPVSMAVEARDSAAIVNTLNSGGRSALLADCTDTAVQPVSLPQPVRRHTVAHKRPRPAVHKLHHKRVKPVPHKVHKKVHRKTVAKRRPVAHRPAVRRAAPLHRVTYAKPLCVERTPQVNAMLGLPDITQPPAILPETVAQQVTDIGPTSTPETAVTNPVEPTIDFPLIPPLGPGPGPFVTTFPPPLLGVPEPASWAMMLLGFGAVGWAIRQRRLRRITRASDPT